MSELKYSTYPGYGQLAVEQYHYSQAVRLGDRIECSGQGGWDRSTSKCHDDIFDQIDQAFENVNVTIKEAGGKGWSQVFRVNSYHVILNDKVMEHMVKCMKKWTPDHAPIWTCVGVTKLAFDEMKVEIEVVAYDPK